MLTFKWAKTIEVCVPSKLGKQPASLINFNLHYDMSPVFQTCSVTRCEIRLIFKHAIHYMAARWVTLSHSSSLSWKHTALPSTTGPGPWQVNNKCWLPFPFPSSSKYNRKMAIWRTLKKPLRLFLGLPFIAFLFHYIGNTPFNSILLAHNSNFVFSIHTYM